MGAYNTNVVLNKVQENQIKYEDILAKVTEYDIFAKYIGNFKIGKIYNSPLREDKNPSFAIFVDKKSGTLLYKDLASDDCGNAVKFVKKFKSIRTYRDALIEISKDLNIDSININLEQKRSYTHKEVLISVIRKPMNEQDSTFWSSFYIKEETLKLYNVNAISKYTINGLVKASYSKESPMYSYKIFNKFKIYRPFEPKATKWRGNLGSLDIQGFEQLPESGETLIITKSLKDVMVLYQLGYNAVAPSSESISIPEIVINNLKSRFKRIIIFYDRDRAGVQFARKAVQKHSLDFIFINKKYKIKDISDFAKKYGVDNASIFLKNSIL
jgi:5S rRNA maturation endonuclease (ribonuclease M5)